MAALAAVVASEVRNLAQRSATAAQEQKAGIGQVNQAVSDMDGMTQQNAALVEEAAAAAASLRSQANDLARMVSAFKLASGPRHAAHDVHPARARPALAAAVC